jgi:hypothetical protein
MTPDTLTRESRAYRVWLDAHNRYQDEQLRALKQRFSLFLIFCAAGFVAGVKIGMWVMA